MVTLLILPSAVQNKNLYLVSTSNQSQVNQAVQRPWFEALTKKAEDVILSHLERLNRHFLAKVLMFKRVAPEE